VAECEARHELRHHVAIAVLSAQQASYPAIIDLESLEHMALSIRYAMKQIRQLAGLPLEPYPQVGHLSPADHAQKDLIDGADHLGIDLGAKWGNEIDLRDPI